MLEQMDLQAESFKRPHAGEAPASRSYPRIDVLYDTPRLSAPARLDDDRRFSVLGVEITNVTQSRALALVTELILDCRERARAVYFVNAHTLNLAAADPSYRDLLNKADCVFGDGTGVRWAARLQRIRVRDNLVGTDLTPALLHALAGRGLSYYLLGTDAVSAVRAARHAQTAFPGWRQAGYHHGYLADAQLSARVVDQINASGPDVLLVGMGNPLQERWIHDHLHELRFPVCLAVGGLLDYWAGNIRRAPHWLRRWGHEWLGLLLQQPHKARRYLIGNPLFLARILAERWRMRRLGSGRLPSLARTLALSSRKVRPCPAPARRDFE
jgi:N-acetylglucosaminyldiphosphoundecaprenol N-acetyl-beta-D-mannosaminyltransferase